MSSAVLVVLVALGAAALASMLMWLVSHIRRNRRRNTPSFLQQLDAVTDRTRPPAGPGQGVGKPRPVDSSPASRTAPAHPLSRP